MKLLSKGSAWTLALALYPAAAYWLFYVPVLVPRLSEWHAIPFPFKAAVVAPYLVLLGMASAGSTWRQGLARSAVATFGAFLFQWQASGAMAPALYHPDLDESWILALRAGGWWLGLFAAMLVVGARTRPRAQEVAVN